MTVIRTCVLPVVFGLEKWHEEPCHCFSSGISHLLCVHEFNISFQHDLVFVLRASYIYINYLQVRFCQLLYLLNKTLLGSFPEKYI